MLDVKGYELEKNIFVIWGAGTIKNQVGYHGSVFREKRQIRFYISSPDRT